MNKILLYVLTVLLLLTACTPYGLTGGPNAESSLDEGVSTPKEKEAMENMKVFPITLKKFEKSMSNNNKEVQLNETETGFETKDGIIQIDYNKENSSKRTEALSDINVLVDQSNSNFFEFEEDFIITFKLLFSSLDIPYDVNKLVTRIKENKTDAVSTDDVSVEITNNKENIQIYISPE